MDAGVVPTMSMINHHIYTLWTSMFQKPLIYPSSQHRSHDTALLAFMSTPKFLSYSHYAIYMVGSF